MPERSFNEANMCAAASPPCARSCPRAGSAPHLGPPHAGASAPTPSAPTCGAASARASSSCTGPTSSRPRRRARTWACCGCASSTPSAASTPPWCARVRALRPAAGCSAPPERAPRRPLAAFRAAAAHWVSWVDDAGRASGRLRPHPPRRHRLESPRLHDACVGRRRAAAAADRPVRSPAPLAGCGTSTTCTARAVGGLAAGARPAVAALAPSAAASSASPTLAACV